MDEPKIVLYKKDHCPFCTMAEKLLIARGGTSIEIINLENDTLGREKLVAQTNQRTLPQIFINEVHVGGYDALLKLDKSGELKTMLMS